MVEPPSSEANPRLMPFEYSWTWNAPLRHLVYQELHGNGVIEPGTGAAAPQQPKRDRRRAAGADLNAVDVSASTSIDTPPATPCGCGCHDEVWLRAASAAAATPSSMFPYPNQQVAARLAEIAGIKVKRLNVWSVRQRNTTRCGSHDAGPGSEHPAAPGPAMHTSTAVDATVTAPTNIDPADADGDGVGAPPAKSRRLDNGTPQNSNAAAPPAPSPVPLTPLPSRPAVPPLPPPGYFYFVLNKKPGTTSMRSSSDQKKISVYDELPTGYPHVPHVGRLDRDTGGLLLFTDDGQFAAGLIDGGAKEKKIAAGLRDELAVKVYHCHTPIPAAELPAGAVASLGTSLESGKDGKKKFTATQPATVRVLASPNCAHPPAAAAATGCVIEITIVEGRNRQVRRLMARAKLPLTKLTRVSIGPIRMGNLEEGGVRPLTQQELLACLDQCLEGRPRHRLPLPTADPG